MKCYRMKHVPTGLYYKPSGWARCKIYGKKFWGEHYRTNLSKKGKIYPAMPTFAWIGRSFYNHLMASQIDMQQLGPNAEPNFNRRLSTSKAFPFVQSEWIIEEVV